MSSVNIWEWIETQEPAEETQRKDLEKQEENTRTFCARKENFRGETPSRSRLYIKPDNAKGKMNYTGKGVHLIQGVRTCYGAVEAGDRGANVLACYYYSKGYSMRLWTQIIPQTLSGGLVVAGDVGKSRKKKHGSKEAFWFGFCFVWNGSELFKCPLEGPCGENNQSESLVRELQGAWGAGQVEKLTVGKMSNLFHYKNEKWKRSTIGINLCLADWMWMDNGSEEIYIVCRKGKRKHLLAY